MLINIIATVGWICFALDAMAVLLLFIKRNVGDDAAGRGMATGFAIILTPILLLAGGGLFWAHASASLVGVIIATLIVGTPYIAMGKRMVKSQIGRVRYRKEQERFGRFADERLTAMGKAVMASDVAQAKLILQAGPLDWTARDDAGETILGFAVNVATSNFGGEAAADIVELLIKAGAKYQDDAIRENGRMFSSVVYGTGDRHVKLIDHLLTAGANPNDTEEYDNRPMLIHHNMSLAKAKVLIAHGADLKGIRDSRTDRPKWDALMNAVYLQEWKLAKFYLEQGCDPTFKAEDNKTVRDVLSDMANEQWRTHDPNDSDYKAFMAALDGK